MDKQSLLARQQVLTDQFNAKRAEIDQKRQEVEAGEAELVKLQGAYAEIENLLSQFVEPEPAIPAGTPASQVIEAEPVGAGEETPNGTGKRK